MNVKDFLFWGNAPWIDFVNTEVFHGPERLDLLPDHVALLRWAVEARLLRPDDPAVRIEPGVTTDTAEREEIWREAIAFRSELRRLATDLAAAKQPARSDLWRINRLLADYPIVLGLDLGPAGFSLTSTFARPGPRSPLALIAQDAARFLGAVEPDLVRACGSPECSILFYDTSKNRKRRWCRMEICGNRFKAAQHRARHTHR
jgi:predicted RNA-binding Zn ribbon-like protein